jgi:hypothetical protein
VEIVTCTACRQNCKLISIELGVSFGKYTWKIRQCSKHFPIFKEKFNIWEYHIMLFLKHTKTLYAWPSHYQCDSRNRFLKLARTWVDFDIVAQTPYTTENSSSPNTADDTKMAYISLKQVLSQLFVSCIFCFYSESYFQRLLFVYFSHAMSLNSGSYPYFLSLL